MKTTSFIYAAAFLAPLLLGCSSTVVRENILASVNTTVGATVMENDRTQLYEARMGFIRHQFYSIPTGRIVDGTNQANVPEAVPQLVSGIRSKSNAKNLFLGSDVQENFATGPGGVVSSAAIAMYASQSALSAYVAKALRDPAEALPLPPTNSNTGDCLDRYWRPVGGRADPDHDSRLRTWISSNVRRDLDPPRFIRTPGFEEQRRAAIQALGINCN